MRIRSKMISVTIKEGYACVCHLQGPMLDMYTQAKCFERDGRQLLGYAVQMRAILSVQKLSRTSFSHSEDYQTYSKAKLRSGDDREPDCYGNVFKRHSIYPAMQFSGISSKLFNNVRGFQPDRQHHLGKKGANDKHEYGVPRRFVASVSWNVRMVVTHNISQG